MANTNLFGDFLSSIAQKGRSIVGLNPRGSQQSAEKLIELCRLLLSSKGEASGIALSFEVLSCFRLLQREEKDIFFKALLDEFSADSEKVADAARLFLEDRNPDNLNALRIASEPVLPELLLRLNQAPDATLSLVEMRQHLLDHLPDNPALSAVDRDFTAMFTSWFNRGFLELRRLDWSSPAALLEKIIQYEAVHGMSGWEDLRARLDPPDRRIYGFFHPRLGDEPLIFVEVALLDRMPSDITTVLATDRHYIDPQSAKTAVFYSISNCQKGLRGVPLGNFLIKQVVEDLKASFPALRQFVTLSPVPSFSGWLERKLDEEPEFFGVSRPQMTDLLGQKWLETPETDARLASASKELLAWYLSSAKNRYDRPLDPVARFHLGNGARLERVNFAADLSPTGLRTSRGLMVNYSYRVDEIERNHEEFVQGGKVQMSPAVSRQAAGFHAKMQPRKNERLDDYPATKATAG